MYKIAVSSAYSIILQCFATDGRSLIYNVQSSGQSFNIMIYTGHKRKLDKSVSETVISKYM